MKSNFKKLYKLLTAPANIYFTLFVGFVVFLFSYWLIARDNGFFSGDMGIIGNITEDIANKKFFSWYFYGQNYFGNLEPLILAVLTRFTGNSIRALYFWEHFFYLISLIFIFCSVNKKSRINVILYFVALFWGIRHIYPYTYYPQGFAFLGMIFSVFFYLFSKIESEKIHFSLKIFLIVGFISGLSLWYNPLLLIIAPIFGAIYLSFLYRSKYKFYLKDILAGFFGVLIGLIPFICASFSTEFANWAWFMGNTTADRFSSIYIVVRDFLFYFINYSILNFSSIETLCKTLILNPRNLAGLVFTILSIYSVCTFVWKSKNRISIIGFAVMTLIMVVNKDYLKDSPIFQYIRYPMFFYILYVGFIINSAFSLIKQKSFVKVSIAIYLILFLIAICFVQIEKKFINANKGSQFYENIYNKLLYKYEINNLYCDNFYDACSAIAFLGKDTLNVQLINTLDSNADRNPRAKFAVDDALERNERVLSLIRADKLKEDHVILETFCMVPGATVYYLIEGSYK